MKIGEYELHQYHNQSIESFGSPSSLVSDNHKDFEMSNYSDSITNHEVKLPAALHDHISCTKLKQDEIYKVKSNVNSNIGSTFNNCSPSESSSSWCFVSTGDTSQGKVQIQRLKEMLLMQLDLIQHQQEQLLKKDRQLQNLKQDREELTTKVEKLEARINVLTKKFMEVTNVNHVKNEMKNDLLLDKTPSTSDFDCQGIQQAFVKLEPDINSKGLGPLAKSNDSLQLNFDQVIFVSSDVTPKNEKVIRSENLINQDETKKNDSSSETNCSKENSANKTGSENKNQPSSSKLSTESALESKDSKGEKRPSSKSKATKRQKTSQNNIQEISPPLSPVNRPPTPNLMLLETEEPYDLYNCRREIRNYLDISTLSNEDDHEKANIEVPSWRINPVPYSDLLTGTESIDDEVFYKRHVKFEIDERRRKRWDIQRLREQRQNEKLRSGRYQNAYYDKPPFSKKEGIVDFVSFFPDPKEVKYIEVAEKLPVMAFGLPIPLLPSRPFSLPWVKSNDTSKKAK